MTSFSPETSPPKSTADRLRSKEAHKSPASRSECSTAGWPKVGSKPGSSPGKATHAPSATSTKLLSSNSHVRTNPGSRNLSVNTCDRFGSGYAMKLRTIVKPVQEAVMPIWILISKITFEGPEPQKHSSTRDRLRRGIFGPPPARALSGRACPIRSIGLYPAGYPTSEPRPVV